LREVEGLEQRILEQMASRGGDRERTEAALAAWRREGGPISSHLIAVGCEPRAALEIVSSASGVGMASLPLPEPAPLPAGFDGGLLWRLLAAPIGAAPDGTPVLAYADPADVASARLMHLPAHHALLALESHVRQLLQTTVGAAPAADTIGPGYAAAEEPTLGLADEAATNPDGPPVVTGTPTMQMAPGAPAARLDPAPPSPAPPSPAPPSPAPPSPGPAGLDELLVSIDRYGLFEQLGEGGMAKVFRGVDRETGREVAMKVLLGHLASDAEFIERFRREARSAAKLKHENVVQVLGYGQDGDSHFLVTELVPCGTVADLVKSMGTLPAAVAAKVVDDVLAGLAVAHASGVVHRDLKPGNLLVGADGTVKVTDFGIAKDADDETLTQTGALLGTPAFMSPEQASGERDLDGRTDLFSLGTVLYKLLTGENPYAHERVSVSMYRVVEAAVPSLLELCPSIPGALEQASSLLSARDRDRRAQTADDVRKVLAPLLAHVQSTTPDLVRRCLEDPGGMRGRLVRAQADDEVARAKRLIELGPAKRAAAAFALYRATMTDPTHAEAAQLLQQLCAVGDIYFGPPKNPHITQTLATIERDGAKVGLVRRLAELYRGEGNVFQAAVYLKRYLALRPEDTHAATQLKALIGDEDPAPWAPSTTALLPLSQVNTQGLVAGIKTGGWRAPQAPADPPIAPVQRAVEVLNAEEGEAVGAGAVARGLWAAYGSRAVVVGLVVAVFGGGLAGIDWFIERSKHDIDHAFDKADADAKKRATGMSDRLDKLRDKYVGMASEAESFGNLQGAERELGRALALEGPAELKAQLYLRRARVRLKREKRSIALDDANKALELAEKDSDIYFDANALVLELEMP
jgi:serine/threonine protein kinase